MLLQILCDLLIESKKLQNDTCDMERKGVFYEAEQEVCELLDTILSNPDWCLTARAEKSVRAVF